MNFIKSHKKQSLIVAITATVLVVAGLVFAISMNFRTPAEILSDMEANGMLFAADADQLTDPSNENVYTNEAGEEILMVKGEDGNVYEVKLKDANGNVLNTYERTDSGVVVHDNTTGQESTIPTKPSDNPTPTPAHTHVWRAVYQDVTVTDVPASSYTETVCTSEGYHECMGCHRHFGSLAEVIAHQDAAFAAEGWDSICGFSDEIWRQPVYENHVITTPAKTHTESRVAYYICDECGQTKAA